MTAKLDAAIEAAQKAADTTSLEDPKYKVVTERLLIALRNKYLSTGSASDLDRAVKVAEDAIAATPKTNPRRAQWLSSLETLLMERYEETDDSKDLNRAIEVGDEAIETISEDNPDRGAIISNHALSFYARLASSRDEKDIDRAVEIARLALEATALDSPERSTRWASLGSMLGTKFGLTRSLTDLNNAVNAAREGFNTAPTDHPRRIGLANNLGMWLDRRFNATKEQADLDEAISVAESILKTVPADLPGEASDAANNLGVWYNKRYKQSGQLEDLNRAIGWAEQTLQTHPAGDKGRSPILSSLGHWHLERYKKTGSNSDLDRAVEFAEESLKVLPPGHPHQMNRVTALSLALDTRYDALGNAADDDRVIEVAKKEISTIPLDHPHRSSLLDSLVMRLGKRFKRLGEEADFEAAIAYAGELLGGESSEITNSILREIATAHSVRFRKTGELEHLHTAIDAAEKAVKSEDATLGTHASSLETLARLLYHRYERLSGLDDLGYAAAIAKRCVEVSVQDDSLYPTRLDILATILSRKFERLGDEKDIEEAIEAGNKALEILPQGNPKRSNILSHIPAYHSMRAGKTRELSKISDAIKVAEEVLATLPRDSDARPVVLHNLGATLASRIQLTRSLDDNPRAIEVAQMAVDEIDPENPVRAQMFYDLGLHIERPDEINKTMEGVDIDRAIKAFKAGWECQNSSPSIRIKCAENGAGSLAMQEKWEEAYELIEAAMQLVPVVVPWSLQDADKEYVLSQLMGLASQAAAISLNAGKSPGHALQLLESGRGVMAGLLLGMRSDISELKAKCPELAERFERLRGELDSPKPATTIELESSNSVETRAIGRREAERKYQELLVAIRAQPGFSEFLLPPGEKHMIRVADDPIVVLNVNYHRCDAFLVRKDRGIEVLELPKLKYRDIYKNRDILKKTDSPYVLNKLLEWLWDVAAAPILDALGYTEPIPASADPVDGWPHIWWVPSGQLSHFPFHAAGRHSEGSKDTVLDRVISSYSSSIKTLIYGRENFRQLNTNNGAEEQAPGEALIVTVPGSGLRFVKDEVAVLEELCPSLNLTPIRPAAERDEILRHLRTCKVFHFASHGQSDPKEPSKSQLVLQHGSALTVSDLRECRLQEAGPFLAYLSACSTRVNDAAWLANEEVHLVSALQLAGFRHVIGTLWAVSDRYCVDVARVLYQTLRDRGMTDRAVYAGLHHAVRTLRKKGLEEFAAKRGVGLQIGDDDVDEEALSAVCDDISVVVDEVTPSNAVEEMTSAVDDATTRQSKWALSKGSTARTRRENPGDPFVWAAYIHFGL
ncbi:hypothetical protein TWF696_000438 [Orbilia brochopaga]|uniref:CHAT domain-containing protein n=1 Tax=Orbilia brochopaga TaxID=3140254 RepID=A0AAV9VHN2_9PEZI